jgi:hypothetical protein
MRVKKTFALGIFGISAGLGLGLLIYKTFDAMKTDRLAGSLRKREKEDAKNRWFPFHTDTRRENWIQ